MIIIRMLWHQRTLIFIYFFLPSTRPPVSLFSLVFFLRVYPSFFLPMFLSLFLSNSLSFCLLLLSSFSFYFTPLSLFIITLCLPSILYFHLWQPVTKSTIFKRASLLNWLIPGLLYGERNWQSVDTADHGCIRLLHSKKLRCMCHI
jgi:hypothetical protein